MNYIVTLQDFKCLFAFYYCYKNVISLELSLTLLNMKSRYKTLNAMLMNKLLICLIVKLTTIKTKCFLVRGRTTTHLCQL